MKHLSHLNLNKNELQNAVIQPLASAPSSPVEGQIYYNTGDDTVYVYANGGWLDLGVQGGGSGVVETIVAGNNIDVDATDPANPIVSVETLTPADIGVAASAAELDILDGATLSTAELNFVDGVTSAIQTQLDAKSTASKTETLTNKTIDANGTGNSISNLETGDFAANVIDTDTALAANSNSRLATQAAVKAYIDSAAVGIDWKPSVRVATTAAGTLASDFENGDTVDGVTLATGDRILIKDQAAPETNGIYVVAASGAPSRAGDANTSAEVTGGLAVWVNEGTANADTGWVLTTNDAITLGTTELTFTQFSGLGQVTAGSALTKTGNTLNVAVDDSTIEVSSDALRTKDGGTTNAKLANMAQATVKGRASGAGTGAPTDLSATQLTTIVEAASATAAGKVELATQAETEAKTDTDRAVTPADLANFPQRKTFTIGDNSATQIDVTHSLGTKEVITQVRQASDDAVVECDITNFSTNVVRLNFSVAPATNALKVVVLG